MRGLASGPHVSCDRLGFGGSERQLLGGWESRLSPLPASGRMEEAQPQVTVFVSFCAIGENTVSQETFQHPDGQKVVSKPQVRGRSPPKRQVFQPPAFLATCKLPRLPGTCLPFSGHLIPSCFLLHQVPRCGEAVPMLSPTSLCPWGRGIRALCSFGLTGLFL